MLFHVNILMFSVQIFHLNLAILDVNKANIFCANILMFPHITSNNVVICSLILTYLNFVQIVWPHVGQLTR
jgi:hypothetical protein